MTLGLMTEKTKGTEPEHMVDFREGVELLKNEYPEKALVKLRRALDSDPRNPYYISFLGLSIARAERNWEQALETRVSPAVLCGESSSEDRSTSKTHS